MATIRRRRWIAGGEERAAWIADFFDASGVRRQKTFRRRKDADAFMVTARSQIAQGVYTPESTSATIHEACERWLERARARNKERGTIEGYRQHVAHIETLIPPGTKLARITKPDCEQFADRLLAAHSPQLARKILQSFRSMLGNAQRQGMVAQNAAADVRIETNGRAKRRLQAGVDLPTRDEVDRLLAAAAHNPRALAMISLATLAGMRISEIRGLRWSNVHLSGEHPVVHVVERADKWAEIGNPKSGDSHRSIPLGSTTFQALRLWKLSQPQGRSLVFGTAADKPDMLGNLTRRLLQPLEDKAGIPRYGWHGFRHYRISSWLQAGLDPAHVQTLAGHGDVSLTLGTYSHFLPRRDDHQRVVAAELLG